jgi:WD40 repeat protein
MFLSKLTIVAVLLGAGMHFFAAPGVAIAADAKPNWRGRATYTVDAGPVAAVALSPDGKLLAVASRTLEKAEEPAKVTVYDTTAGKAVATLRGHEGPVAFSPDGKLLATGTSAGTVRLVDVGKWQERMALKGLSDTVLCLALSPDGKFLVAGSGDPSKPNTPGMVRLWDLENGGERATHTHPGAVYGVAFDADGKRFLSASSGAGMVIKSWDGRAGGKPVEAKGVAGGRGGRFLTIAFAPDGKTVAAGIDPVGDTSEMDVKVWDRTTGKERIKPLRHPELVQDMAVSPDGKILATGSSALVGETARIGVVRLWDASTGKELADLRGHKGEVRCLAFGPQGRTLATGGWDGTVKLWERDEPDGKLPAKAEKEDDRWAKSEDGVIGVRLRARFDPVKVDNAIILLATVRNFSDKPVTVPKPFGGPWGHHLKMVGLAARGPKGELKWKGPEIQPRKIAADDFVELAPGEEVEGEFYITADEYSNCDCEGAFDVTYTYSDFARYFEGAKDDRELLKALPALERLWSGAVPAVRLKMTKADPKPPTPEQLEQLKKKLVAALGDRFDFVEGRAALKRGDRYWLATIRPRREGEFVLRYVLKYDKPDRWGTDGQAVVYHLVIGKAGAPRVYHLGQFESWVGAYPHACVGDAVTLPVPLDHTDNFAEWTFEMPDRVPKREENWFRIIKDHADKSRAMEKQPGDIEVRNGADDVFDLVTGTVESLSSRRGGGPTRHAFVSAFDVAKSGKFTIETALTGKKQPEPPRASFEVVAKEQPLSVLINRWDVGATAGEAMGGGSVYVTLNCHPLRVGDRLILFSGEYATTGAEPVKHPRVEVAKKPLDPSPEPFRLMSK